MSDRIHTGVYAMQAAGADPALNRFFRKTQLQKLPPPHHPVLPIGQLGQPTIIPARPQKPVLNKGFCGLGGHTLEVDKRGRACGALNVTLVCRLRARGAFYRGLCGRRLSLADGGALERVGERPHVSPS